MILMMLIMSFPVLGLGLFYVLPLGTTLLLYLIMLGISLPFHCMMMRSMRLPAQAGSEGMIGSAAGVLDWQGDSGRVICRGEIWQAKASEETSLVRGDKIVIEGMTGLKLSVKKMGAVADDGWMSLLVGSPNSQPRIAVQQCKETARVGFGFTA